MNLRFLGPPLWMIANLAIASTSFAQTQYQPNSQGDYFRNEAPIQAPWPANSRNNTGGLWQVVSPGLNCRSSAGTKYETVRQFKRGTLLQADIGRGGSDEVLINGTDEQGRPWMRVKSQQGADYRCYVRANQRYIKPYWGKK